MSYRSRSGGAMSGVSTLATVCAVLIGIVRFCSNEQESARNDRALNSLRTFEVCSGRMSSVRASEAVRSAYIRGCEGSCLDVDERSLPLGKVGCMLTFAIAHPIVEDPPAPEQECDRLSQPPRIEMGKVEAYADGVAQADIRPQEAAAACEQAINQFPRDWRFLAYAGRAAEAAGDAPGAVKLYQAASLHGSAVGEYQLALMHGAGSGGLRQNEFEAMRLFQYAARSGHALAAREVADEFVEGRTEVLGLVSDEQAVAYMRIAMALGDAAAEFGLGRMTEEGRGGLNKDEQEAVRLYRLAADQGSEGAKTALDRLGAR